ncbi:hypothetical protein C0L75_02880 [Clostridium perfringens]
MLIDVQNILELIIVVTTIKLITSRYQPPIQESIQALICIGIGTVLSLVINFSTQGFITGVVGSGLAFYGKDLIQAFKSVESEIKNLE